MFQTVHYKKVTVGAFCPEQKLRGHDRTGVQALARESLS